MHIEELSSKTNNKYVTVTLSYDECRDISNALYNLQKDNEKYKDIYGKCKILFDMVKHGNIQPETIELLSEKQETSCDIEKVVEQLENLEPFHVDGYGDVMVNIDDVIEIVKQGGCGINDVCEWKCPKEIMDNTEFEVSCNSNPLKKGVVPNNFSFCDFRYCPYCGRKIKVVE